MNRLQILKLEKEHARLVSRATKAMLMATPEDDIVRDWAEFPDRSRFRELNKILDKAYAARKK